MFLAGPVPGRRYCGISRADVGCYFKGIHVHECTGEWEASESALGHRAGVGSPFPIQNVNLILGGQRSLPLVQLSAKKKRCPLKRKLHCCVWLVWTLWPHFKTGLPLGPVDALQSHFNAKRQGETVLHTDVGFLPRLPQCPGLYQIPVEMCLQELCATKHKDYVFSRLFFSFHSTQFAFPNKC